MYTQFSQVADIQPKQAVNVVVTRLKRIKQQEGEISDYFKERSIVEQIYAQQLQKLGKKFSQVTDSVLGEVGKAWQIVASNANDTSKQHQLLSERMTSDSDWKSVDVKQFEVPLSKLAKEWHDKNQKLEKASEAKVQKYKEALDGQTAVWAAESSQIFQKVEDSDRQQVDAFKQVMLKNVDFQISNLQLQLMNLESTKKIIESLDVDKEVQAFLSNHTKHFQKVDMNMFSPTQSPPASVTTKEEVDADGYKIPQMDRQQWKKEVQKADSDSDAESQAPQKFNIDIKDKAVPSESQDIELAAAFLKDSLVPQETGTRKQRRQVQAEDPFGSLNALPQDVKVVTLQQAGYIFKCLEVVTGSYDSQEIVGTLFMIAGQYQEPMASKLTVTSSLSFTEVYDNVQQDQSGTIIVDLKKFSRSDIERPLAKYSMKGSLQLPLLASAKIRLQDKASQLLIQLEPKSQNIKDLSVLVNVDDSTTSVTTKPQAVYNKERQKVLWKLGDISTMQKLLSQWDAASADLQPVMVRFILNGVNVSGIQLKDQDQQVLPLQFSQGVAMSVAMQKI